MFRKLHIIKHCLPGREFPYGGRTWGTGKAGLVPVLLLNDCLVSNAITVNVLPVFLFEYIKRISLEFVQSIKESQIG